MKFFLPEYPAGDAERAYEAIRRFVGEGGILSPRRIYKLAFKHNGTLRFAQIGREDPLGGELLTAILYLPKRDLYLLCTPNRGVLRGDPIMAGGHLVLSEDFE